MPQLSHEINMPIARAGMSDSGMGDTISRAAEDTFGAAAGTFMVPGTDAEQQAVVPTTAAEITDGSGLGVVRLDVSREPAREAAAISVGNEYDPTDALPIQAKNRIWVLCDAGAVIVPDTPCFVRYAVGAGGSKLGVFRQDADTASAAALPNYFFRSAHKDVTFGFGGTQRIALVECLSPSA